MVHIFLHVVLPGERNCNHRCQSGSITTASGYSLCIINTCYYSVIIILGQACLVLRFFLGIYIRIQYIAIIKTVRTISTAIHLCVLTLSYCFLSIIQLLACISTGFILFFSNVPSTGTIPRSNNNDAMRLQSMQNGARPD